MITEATIARTKYFPEKLPDSVVTTIAATAEATPIILDLKRFSPLLVRLAEVAVDQDDDVEMRFKVDNTTLSPLAGSMYNLLQNNFSLMAKSRTYYNLYNSSGGVKNNFKSFYSLWLIKPTTAHKLRYGLQLTPEDMRLIRELGVQDTVEKGLLPLPLTLQLSREFQIIQEETHGVNIAVPTAGIEVETIVPQTGEFLVLVSMTADPGAAAANNVRIAIDRDYESDYVEFPTWGLGAAAATNLGKEIGCFIPALNELRIKLKTTVADTINIRYTIWKCALTNIMRARWGLASRDELPGDVYDKVMAGVL